MCFSTATFYVPVSGRNPQLSLPAPLSFFFEFYFYLILSLSPDLSPSAFRYNPYTFPTWSEKENENQEGVSES